MFALNFLNGSVSKAQIFAKKGTKILSSFEQTASKLRALNSEIEKEQVIIGNRITNLEAAKLSNSQLVTKNEKVASNIEKLIGL